jgi:hypothetical protein
MTRDNHDTGMSRSYKRVQDWNRDNHDMNVSQFPHIIHMTPRDF